MYGFVSNVIRILYKYRLFKVYRFPLSVVIVGNLTVGGNGKTPVVLWLVQQLKNRGWFVGVVSRGYGGHAQYYPIILGYHIIDNTMCGDEPLLIWQRTGVPVAVSPRRSDAVSILLEVYPYLDVIISDDGLQHYALERDIEWVVVNSERRFGNGWWIPAGPMRERRQRLNTVQSIIFYGNKLVPGEISARLLPVSVVSLLTGERKLFTFFSNVVAMAGISYPSQFFSTLRNYGIMITREISFSDHQVYSEKMLCELVKNNEILLMTEKDAVKCRSFARVNWWYLEVELKLGQEETCLLLSLVEKNIRKYKKM